MILLSACILLKVNLSKLLQFEKIFKIPILYNCKRA